METDRNGPASDEPELIRAACDGDARAFEDLLRRHRDRIFGVAYHIVGNAEEARDVAQNVMIRLWRVLPRYDPRYAFTTWLYRMTVNLAIDSLRRGAHRGRETELEETLVPAVPMEGPGGPESVLREVEVGRILDELLTCLPPQQRAVFVLREVEGESSEEIARAMGLSASTIRNHLFQARRTLRAELARRYPEYLPRPARGEDR